MGLIEIIAGEEVRPPDSKGLSPHQFVGIILQVNLGRLTRQQAATRMNISGTIAAEIGTWLDGFPRDDPDFNPIDATKVHSILNILEGGLITVAEAKTELDWP
ncbi:MAG: hypothetical protein GY719_10080 [bacterium]|nr:hypothetical protein [bacterium]